MRIEKYGLRGRSGGSDRRMLLPSAVVPDTLLSNWAGRSDQFIFHRNSCEAEFKLLA